MAKKTNNRKPVSAATKGLVCLVLLLALTVFVSVLGFGGMKLDSEGVNILLPWVPAKGNEWPASLPMNRALDGGVYAEYTVALEEGAAMEDVIRVINARLDGFNENDRAVTAVGEDVIRIELRKMASDRLSSVRGMAVMKGHFEFRDSDGNAVLTEKDVQKTLLTMNDSQTTYQLRLTLTDEGKQKAADANAAYLTAYADGEQVTTATISGDTMTLTFLTSNFNAASNVAYLLGTGAVNATLTQTETGTTDASSALVKSVVFYAGAALLICACLYLCLTGKLTGLSGIWTVWCAVLLGLFFTATLVVPSVNALDVGCLIAALLGILLAVYTAADRKDAISRNISDGLSPKQASKLGFRASAKQIWIVHGIALAVSLVLMIFSFSKPTGYTLAAFVVGSAITVVLMRAFQACFTAITAKASLFGKTK